MYKEFVFIDAPIRPDTLNTDRWECRGGRLTDDGPVSIQPKTEKQFFKISDVQWQRYWPATQTKSEGLGEDITNSIGIFTERSADDDIQSESFMDNIGEVEARFSVSEPYTSSAYIMDKNGKNLKKTN